MGNPTTPDLLEKINRLCHLLQHCHIGFNLQLKKKNKAKDCLFLLFSLDLFLSVLACVGGFLKFLSCFVFQFFTAHILVRYSPSAGCDAGAHEGGQSLISAYNSNG